MHIKLYRDKLFSLHRQAEGHPERPERLEAIERMLSSAPFADLLMSCSGRDATCEEIQRVHAAHYVERVAATAGIRLTRFDGDTSANENTFAAAVRAAGCAVEAVEAVIAGPQTRAFVLGRPPGHHAERGHAGGFCYFNNAAVAAEHARAMGIDRVCILDWDVHHGNGTMHSFYERGDVLYASIHEYPHYPGTGLLGDVGTGEGEGATVSVPMPAGCQDDEYLYVLNEVVMPIARAFAPEIVIVSAGYDAHWRDPLAGMELSGAVYGAFSALDRALSDEFAAGRLVYLLEGGYDLTALREGVYETMRVLTGSPAQTDPAGRPDARVLGLTEELTRIYRPYWPDAL